MGLDHGMFVLIIFMWILIFMFSGCQYHSVSVKKDVSYKILKNAEYYIPKDRMVLLDEYIVLTYKMDLTGGQTRNIESWNTWKNNHYLK